MTPRLCIFGLALLSFTTSTVLADDVLYCTDTAVTGFKWPTNGSPTSGSFREERFTIKVVSDEARVIASMVGTTVGRAIGFECKRFLPGVIPERVTCWDLTGGEFWVFFRNTYSRTFVSGPPTGGTDPNIFVGYGTCTKF
jgi:hypothetical protein